MANDMTQFSEDAFVNTLQEHEKLNSQLVISSGLDLNDKEEWKHANLNFLSKKNFQSNNKSLNSLHVELSLNELKPKVLPLLKPDCHNIVFVNNKIWEEISNCSLDFEDITRAPINYILRDVHPNYFQALVNSHITAGFYLNIQENFNSDKNLNIIFINNQVSSNYFTNLKNVIFINSNSKIKISTNYLDFHENQYFSNIHTDIFVGENAEVEFDKNQNQNQKSYHVETLNIDLEHNSKFKALHNIKGAAFSKDLVRSYLDSENSNVALHGILQSNNKQHLDVLVEVNHLVANCKSLVNYRGIADDLSTVVFNGVVYVEAMAEKTDSQMQNKNLLLKDTANVFTKPVLIINNDDVRCTHGATVGSLDANAMFYLQARGLSSEQAKVILLQAFIEEITRYGF